LIRQNRQKTIFKKERERIEQLTMAKSIRSKCKRKARSEFRKTIGNEFYQKNMKKIQTKLKECAEKQSMSMESLERLSNAFHPTSTEDDASMVDNTLSDELIAAKACTGENKVPGMQKKSKRRKHALKKSTIIDDRKEKKEKQRPRYFVQF